MSRFFISHNSADKDYARRLAAALEVHGVQVWFDEWDIKVGESIPEAVSAGLDNADQFVLLWSANAAKSAWVAAEMNATIGKWLSERSKRILPIQLDGTAMPTLICHLKYVSADGQPMPTLVEKILGLDGDRERRRAMQRALEESEQEIREYEGYGPLLACPKCGAGHEYLEVWSAVDEVRDDFYAGARCKECGWNDGGEVPR